MSGWIGLNGEIERMANPLRPYPARAPEPLGRGSVTHTEPLGHSVGSGRTSAMPLVSLQEEGGERSESEAVHVKDALAFEFYPASTRTQPAPLTAVATGRLELENVDPGTRDTAQRFWPLSLFSVRVTYRYLCLLILNTLPLTCRATVRACCESGGRPLQEPPPLFRRAGSGQQAHRNGRAVGHDAISR